MKFKYLILILGLFYSTAQADRTLLYPWYLEGRLQKNSDQSSSLKNISSYSLGYQRDSVSVLFERQKNDDHNGNQSLSIHKNLESYNLVARYLFNEGSFRFYAGGAAGVHQETITTHLLGVPTEEQSDWDPLIQVLGGLQVNRNEWLFLEIEGRVLNGKHLDPVNTVGILFRLGVGF